MQDKNYNNLINKPKINHIEIEGDHEPGYYGIGTYNLPENGIPESDLADGVKEKLNASSENTEKIDGIAPSVESMTADRDYNVGEILYINGILYRVTTKVLANTPFVIGNNIEQTTLNNEIDNINDEINKLKIANGAESYDLNSGEITTNDKNVYTLFFMPNNFYAKAGEDYLFIVIPNSSSTNSGYNINIYSENGDVAYTFNSGNNIEDYKNERRFTFTPVASGYYYCGIKKDADGTGYPVVQTVKLQYTPSQAGESLVQMVSELLPLKEDVEGLSAGVAKALEGKAAFDAYPDAINYALGKRPAIFYPGYYRTPAAGTLVDYHDDPLYMCTRFAVTPGEIVHVCMGGYGGSARAWVFIDSNGNSLGQVPAGIIGERKVTVPDEAVEMAINNRLSLMETGYYAYRGVSAENTVSPSGEDQTAEIVQMLSEQGECKLAKGVFFVNNIVMPNNSKLSGCGESTKLKLIGSETHTLVTMGDKCTIKDISFYGSDESINLTDDIPINIDELPGAQNAWTYGSASVENRYTGLEVDIPAGTYKIGADLVRDDSNNYPGKIVFYNSVNAGTASKITEATFSKTQRTVKIVTIDQDIKYIRFVSATNPTTNTLPSVWNNIVFTPMTNLNRGIAFENSDYQFGIIEGCRFYNFNYCGLFLEGDNTLLDRNIVVSDCFFIGNNCGIAINKNREYCRFANCVFIDNYYGCYNRGGNNYFDNCGFDRNYIGMIIDEKIGTNAGHGCISNCSFNHSAPNNTGYALIIDHEQSERICNCIFGYSKISLISPSAITFTACAFRGGENVIDGGRSVPEGNARPPALRG